jgi:hypothetical protein
LFVLVGFLARITLIASVLVWLPETARAAESDVAAEMFRAGSRAFARGEFRAAALSFEEAHRRTPHAASVFNAALAWEAAGEKARAADAYAEALARKELGAAQGKEARARLDELRRSLVGLVRLSGSASILVSVAHLSRRALPVEVHLAPGEHTLTFEHPDGTRESRRLVIDAAAHSDQTVLARPPRPPQGPTTAGIATGPGPSEPPPTRSPSLRITGWSLLVTAAVAAGLAGYLGTEAVSSNTTFKESKYTDQAAHDRAVRMRTGTNLAWAGSAALAITGAILIWRY